MESLILLQPSSRIEFVAETPSQTPLPQATLDSPDAPQTRKYQFQASKAEIPNQASAIDNRTHGRSQENKSLNSNEYSDVLYNVYKEDICNSNIDQDHKLLIISVHAVFLESGFVCLQSGAEKKIDGFQFPAHWGSNLTASFQYTIHSLLVHSDAEAVETVGLKFQTMGKFVYVHGSLGRNTPVGFIRLDASRFITSINFICTSKFDSTSVTDEAYESSKSFHEDELFELWKIAKNALALPLLIDLCVKTGLEPPPCFTSLLTDIKLKILEFLPGIDIARVGCVASELRYLSSNNDLWKQKCIEEFALSDSEELSGGHWKEKYVTARENSRRKKGIRRIPTCGGGLWRLAYSRHRGDDRDQQPQIIGNSQVITVPAQRY